MRLRAHGASATGWTQTTVTGILPNPKYTGYMVFGRKRTFNGKKRPVPPAEWLWSPQPSHPALIDRDTWDAAQATGTARGNARDAEMPTTQPGRRYPLRSRIRCNACQRRMHGITKRNRQGRPYTYYVCSHDPTNPRLAALYPDHGRVTLSGVVASADDVRAAAEDAADVRGVVAVRNLLRPH